MDVMGEMLTYAIGKEESFTLYLNVYLLFFSSSDLENFFLDLSIS